jgi:hypothetical protein
VETAERGQEFAFTRTEPGGGIIRWFYRFEPGPGGTTAELGYQVLRPVPGFPCTLSLRALAGVRDLRATLHSEHGHQPAKLARIAERQAQQAATPAAATGSPVRPAQVRPDDPVMPSSGALAPACPAPARAAGR